MTIFNYGGPAELFARKDQGATTRSPMMSYRFATGTEALRFAIERLPVRLLSGAILEIDENRFGHLAMRKLYESAEYPLKRPARKPPPHAPARAIENIQGAMSK